MRTIATYLEPSEVMRTKMWQTADAARLKTLREMSDIEANQFARLSSISITQLQQLEGEGDSAFYSPLIKYHVGKKLLSLFGEQTVAETDTPLLVVVDETDEQSLQAIPNKLSHKDQMMSSLDKIAEISNREFNPPVHKAIASSVSLCWREHVIFSRLVALFLVAFVGNYFLKVPLVEIGEKYFSGNVKVNVDPSISKPPDDKPAELIVTTASTPTSAPSLAAPSALVAANTKTERFGAERDCLWTETPMSLKSPQPTKSADYVYLVAVKDATACVIDQNKQTTTHNLKAGQSQTVNGKAPFRVYSERMADVMIFFQGHRVIVPNKDTTDVLLTEVHIKQ